MNSKNFYENQKENQNKIVLHYEEKYFINRGYSLMIDARDGNLGGKNKRFKLTRRGFLQATGALGAAAAFTGGGLKFAEQLDSKAVAAEV